MMDGADMAARTANFARKASPFILAWLVLHAAVLAMLALGWGLAIALKAVLGWLFHTLAFVVLLAGGVALAVWLWKAPQPRRLPRPA
jgi:hypothetical protein